MINIVFYMRGEDVYGFEISGHSTNDADDTDGRLVCSAVSSAAIMTANTITEIIGDEADVDCSDGYLSVAVSDVQRCALVLGGLRLHLEALQQQYPDKIKLSYGE